MNASRIALLVAMMLLVGAGCADMVGDFVPEPDADLNPYNMVKEVVVKKDISLPLDTYDATYKRYGEYIDDRFNGYHVGDDLEVVHDNKKAEKVYAIADGRVDFVDWVDGYGGVIGIDHDLCLGGPGYESECMPFSSLYGHLDIEYNTVSVNDMVEVGDVIAILGEGETRETDGERKHLHFSISEDLGTSLPGYINNPDRLVNWVNPSSFFENSGIEITSSDWISASSLVEPSGRSTFPLDFEMPGSWDVEWVPSIKSWNLYDTRGDGIARERSQVFIRYFDASSFLTLSTVTIHEQTDLTVGKEDYTARRYDIEKNVGVRDFPEQPSWRNERHVVTDFFGENGFTRYYVVAANPELDVEIYERILESMTILK